MTQYAFAFDSSKCSGCRTCQVLCKETYDLPLNNLFRRVINYQGGSWSVNETGTYVPNGMFGYFISMGCNHCTDPVCVKQCPTGAMRKNPDTGIVTTDPPGAAALERDNIAAVTVEVKGIGIQVDDAQGTRSTSSAQVRRRCACAAAAIARLISAPLRRDAAKYGDGKIETAPLPKTPRTRTSS